MARILAIDFGTKRVGLAETDPLQIIASGLDTIDRERVVDYIRAYFSKNEVETVVIGQGKRHDNSLSQSEGPILEFIEELKSAIPNIKIERQDERFTSKIAFQSMIDGGLGKKARQNKGLIDKISAVIILQSYLESK